MSTRENIRLIARAPLVLSRDEHEKSFINSGHGSCKEIHRKCK